MSARVHPFSLTDNRFFSFSLLTGTSHTARCRVTFPAAVIPKLTFQFTPREVWMMASLRYRVLAWAYLTDSIRSSPILSSSSPILSSPPPRLLLSSSSHPRLLQQLHKREKAHLSLTFYLTGKSIKWNLILWLRPAAKTTYREGCCSALHEK